MIAPSIERSSSSSCHRGPPVGLGAGVEVEVGGAPDWGSGLAMAAPEEALEDTEA